MKNKLEIIEIKKERKMDRLESSETRTLFILNDIKISLDYLRNLVK